MTTTATTVSERGRSGDALLRGALLGNALFSAVSGLALLLFARPLGTLLGTVSPWILGAVGVGLLAFAADVWRSARRRPVDLSRAQITVFSDLAWVAGSVVVLLLRPSALSTLGLWLVADVALVVFGFAVAQQLGIRRLQVQ